MKIHEYQAKQLLTNLGVATPAGRVASDAALAEQAAQELGVPVVVKAQIHAGGRGKGGGVRLARSLDEVRPLAEKMLGAPLVTHQTGPQGRIVRRLLIEKGVDLDGAREMYLAVVVDRATMGPVLLASAQGGVEIEDVAAKDPSAILREAIDPVIGFQPYMGRRIAAGLGLAPALWNAATAFMQSLVRAFVDLDASLLEINPWLLTRAEKFLALDAKLNLDDNAAFRHADHAALRDLDEEAPEEIDAAQYQLNYIKLEGGNVGCMVNGAGLAMATMDIIKLAGGNPANFLDVGGGASADQIRNAFRILLSDSDVRAVWIHIFGGILRCDTLAEGVIAAVRDLSVRVPVVVRMRGNREEQGKAMLRDSGLDFTTADSMQEAARLAVSKAGGAR